MSPFRFYRSPAAVAPPLTLPSSFVVSRLSVYFLFVAVLNWVPALNVFGKEVSFLPLLAVLAATAVKVRVLRSSGCSPFLTPAPLSPGCNRDAAGAGRRGGLPAARPGRHGEREGDARGDAVI